jgi:hypothetical protein
MSSVMLATIPGRLASMPELSDLGSTLEMETCTLTLSSRARDVGAFSSKADETFRSPRTVIGNGDTGSATIMMHAAAHTSATNGGGMAPGRPSLP